MKLNTVVTALTMTLLAPATLLAAGQAPVDTGTTAWILISTALVLIMVPGLAIFYGGLVRTKNVLDTRGPVASGAWS